MWPSALRAQETLLSLRPLRDVGGLPPGLNLRLTTALSRFLNDHTEKAFRVASAAPLPAVTNSAAVRYTLEGELSYANGQGEENARFLLVTRLYREDAPRLLVGQWAGTSASLRYLTTNLRNVPDVHTLGLVGEMGSQIALTLRTDQSGVGAQWRRLLPHLTARNPTTTEIVMGGGETRTLRQVPADTPFHLRLRASGGVQTYLLTSDGYGVLHLVPLTSHSAEMRAQAGETLLSPPLTLPEGTREVWIVSRPLPDTTGQRPRSVRQCALDETDSPVHLLSGVGKGSPPPPEAALTQFLAEIARKPGLWSVQPLRVAEPKP